MHKIECPRCLGGKGEIRAFRHVQGGVCFRCKRRLSTVWQILIFLRG